MYQVDYARFHQTVPVSEGVVSRDSAKRQATSCSVDDEDTSTTTDGDDAHDHGISSYCHIQGAPKKEKVTP